jgi:nitroreductase
MREPMSVDKALTTTRSVRRRLDLTRPVAPELIIECLKLAQQAPTQSDSQSFHFVVVTEPAERAVLGELFRRGYEIYRTLPTGLYALSHDDPKRERARHRAIASLEHLVEHIHEVPVHVIPCIEGSLDGPPIVAAITMASVVPAAWSFMLAARSRGLATCWTNMHMLTGADADRAIGLPPGVMQVALIATAHAIGTDFKPAHRRPLDEIVHYDRW